MPERQSVTQLSCGSRLPPDSRSIVQQGPAASFPEAPGLLNCVGAAAEAMNSAAEVVRAGNREGRMARLGKRRQHERELRGDDRYRRRRRLIAAASVLLLVGAIVNVGVAWALGAAPASWTPGDPAEVIGSAGAHPGSAPLTAAEQSLLTRRMDIRRHGRADGGYMLRGLGWTTMLGFRSRGDADDWAGRRHEAGWPARSMVWSAMRLAPDNDYRLPSSVEPPESLRPGSGWLRYPRERIGLTPLAAGFAVNTLLYAVVVGAMTALPLSLLSLRRWARVRRGRCGRCGYDLAGAPGVCPECGRRRSSEPEA